MGKKFTHVLSLSLYFVGLHFFFHAMKRLHERRVKLALKPEEVAELELSLPNICTTEDAPKVFRALDGNGNGKIEMREFSDWFVAGSIRSAKQQVCKCLNVPNRIYEF